MVEPANQGGALLETQNLSVRFGALRAVRGVSMQLFPGMLLGLIGPNGAGKTTLLRALCGLQRASGDVRIFGETLLPNSVGLFRHIGFTPDTPPVYEDLTVRRFLQFIARGYDLSGTEIDERINFWLEKVWLTEKADQKIKGLSRGMRQRIGIARTMLANPNIVLLDEPAAGLDPAGRVQFRQLLCSLREQGKALIVSSHILSDMSEYCSHIGIMSAGTMIQIGTVSEVIANTDGTRNRYTIVLAKPVAGLASMIEAIDGISHADVNQEGFTVEYHSGKEQAALLLEKLIALRLPVASFSPNALDLESAYLRAGIRQVD